MTLEEENAHLRAENTRLQQCLSEALERIAVLERQQAEREPPAWVKPNRSKPVAPKQPRKQRAASQNGARKREAPTRTVRHVLDQCPTCQYVLRGESVARRRQVIELPPPPPVEVIEHVVIKRWCPKCARWRLPRLDLRGQTVSPQGRIGVRLGSTIAYDRTVLRLPVRQVQANLRERHRCMLSSGEVVEVTHQIAARAAPTLAGFKQTAVQSAVVHGDETGWRENGQNGYIWCFSTPGDQAVRLYEYDASRSGAVVQRTLTHQFAGHLVSDFYGGYNIYAGKHQRCWVHLVRDLHKLKETHASNESVQTWAQAVRNLYDDAQRVVRALDPPTQSEREQQYVRLVAQVHVLGLQYAQAYDHPCCALSKRLLRHEDELFQFVLVVGLAADNNLAERSLRPVVVVRKISGGTRSSRGSTTRMALASLFGTWQARGLNPLEQCLTLLSHTVTDATTNALPRV